MVAYILSVIKYNYKDKYSKILFLRNFGPTDDKHCQGTQSHALPSNRLEGIYWRVRTDLKTFASNIQKRGCGQ